MPGKCLTCGSALCYDKQGRQTMPKTAGAGREPA